MIGCVYSGEVESGVYARRKVQYAGLGEGDIIKNRNGANVSPRENAKNINT